MAIQEHPTSPSLYITAVLDEASVTISGPPTTLSRFSEKFSAGPIIPTTVDTLYHIPAHSSTLREQVLGDITSRGIRFPKRSEILLPIRSTFSGQLIGLSDESTPLVELVVDMLLIQQVDWHRVSQFLAKDFPKETKIQLWNFGPGTGVVRNIERTFPQGSATVLDHSSPPIPQKEEQSQQGKQEPIAIVGMAVNLPGAPDVSKLWELLEQGINTISEVSAHFRRDFYLAQSSGH